MNSKTAIAALIGFVVNFLGGYLIYDLLLGNFYGSHQGLQGIGKETPDMWAVALGCLTFSLLLAYIFGRWAGIKTPKTGFQAGAVIGLLFGIASYSWIFGTSNMWDSPVMIAVEGLTMAVLAGCTGAAIGWWLGRGE